MPFFNQLIDLEVLFSIKLYKRDAPLECVMVELHLKDYCKFCELILTSYRIDRRCER